MNVTLDTSKIQGVNLAELNPDQIKELMLDDESDEAIEDEEFLGEIEDEETTLNIAAIGGYYKIGPLKMQSVLGNLVLLNTINSPLTSGLSEGQELEFDDVAKALYVLANGKDAIDPIMEISQRIGDLLLLKPMVKGNPDLFKELLDRVESISEARKTFLKEAVDFYNANFVGHDFQQIVNEMLNMILDIGKGLENLPIGESDSTVGIDLKKK